jgi:hypothetical protein
MVRRLRRAIERGRGGLGRRESGTVTGEDEVRCERERERGRQGDKGGFPGSLCLSLCTKLQRKR